MFREEDWDTPLTIFMAQTICFVCLFSVPVSIMVFDAPIVGGSILILFVPALAVPGNVMLKFPGAFLSSIGVSLPKWR